MTLRPSVALLLTLLHAPVALLATAAADNTGAVVDNALLMRPLTLALDEPWGMDFLANGDLLVTQHDGTLLRVRRDSGELVEIAGVPDATEYGQGGLMDVLVDDTAEGTRIYLSYTHRREREYTTRAARGRLEGDRLLDVEVLFTALPYYNARHHFGSRLLIVDDYLFITVGDRRHRHDAQDLSRHNGSVIRIHRDGRVPENNPFVDTPEARPEIWTYGHRNPQGLARHPDGSIWISEHGPRGGDELNRLRPGRNYGWPVITYGREYSGGKIGEGTSKPGMEQPEKFYMPSIATAGMDFYTGDIYPGWSDSLLVGALKLTHLNRVELDGKGLGRQYRHFDDSKLRFRDVQVGPDGYVYVLADDGLYRIEPRSGG